MPHKTLNKQKIFAEDALYSSYDLSELNDDEITSFFTSGSIDAYCTKCKKRSVFRLNDDTFSYNKEKSQVTKFGLITVKAKCTRENHNELLNRLGNCDNIFYAIFKRYSNDLLKIGQYPSKGDMDFGELDDSYKELPDYLRTELGTSIGLYAHGVGIGAFVYLRRIFEILLEEAHQIAKKEEKWEEDKYIKSRVTERIQLLSKFLPTRLVQSANLYGVLSKGLHELSEEECKSHYTLVRQAIQLILKQKHEDKEYDKVVNKINNIN
ncbi:MAG: hypothetical protein WAQ53_02360 [Thiofilum sp.]|uniref:hypothetical protein n=1 Tax=Thiofilum sp. TaxID=2212733 RepID=UPI0025F8924D|nr:hypothetical protein [Thiofilum sp.]MBK8454530.1 hypothetical protein [Thiofilum sp.]